MADHAHDVRPLAVRIDRVAHRLAIDREARVLRGELPVPVLQGAIEVLRINAYQHVADDREARYQVLPAHPAAAKARPCALGKMLGPLGDMPVAARPTEGGGRGDREHYREPMAPSLAAARIGDVLKEGGQGLHLRSGEHQFRSFPHIRGWQMRLAQEGARLAAEAAQEDFLRGLGGVGIPALAAPVAARVPDVQPVGGLIERAAVALRVNEGFEQEDRVAERLQPIPSETSLAQGQGARRHVRPVPLGQNTKPRVIGQQRKARVLLPIAPADPPIAHRALQGRR